MASVVQIVQALTISTALIGAGGIATLSLFAVPILQSQPADRALPSTRWLFSRGSHVFPTAIFSSSIGFIYLAYASLPAQIGTRPLAQILKAAAAGNARNYAVAALLSLGAGLYTSRMIPNNFALIEYNERKGGARSAKSAEAQQKQNVQPGSRSAEASVQGKDDVNEFTDLTAPQGKSDIGSSSSENLEVQGLLAKFGRQNWNRALLLGSAGMLGLFTALS